MKKHRPKDRNRKTPHANQPPRSAASDTYTNPPAFLGAASNLISSGTWIRSGLTSNTDLLTTLYRESWLAKRIIDMCTSADVLAFPMMRTLLHLLQVLWISSLYNMYHGIRSTEWINYDKPWYILFCIHDHCLSDAAKTLFCIIKRLHCSGNAGVLLDILPDGCSREEAHGQADQGHMGRIIPIEVFIQICRL